MMKALAGGAYSFVGYGLHVHPFKRHQIIYSSITKVAIRHSSTNMATTNMATKRVYNFSRGHPNKALVPVQEMQTLMHEVASSGNAAFLQKSLHYGADAGEESLRLELAGFISRQSQVDDIGSSDNSLTNEASPENFFITSGVSHGVELLTATLTRPGDLVLVERPTYFLIKGIFECHQLQVQGLPMRDDSSIDLDILAESFASGKMKVPRLVYVIPTNQNPTGRTMSFEDRVKLSQLAAKFGFIVIADEVYHLLDWRVKKQERPARMAVLNHSTQSSVAEKEGTSDDFGGSCISVSAFTKIFAPGVRTGWIEAPPLYYQQGDSIRLHSKPRWGAALHG
jgi:2-aminoadipate transaminase